MNLLYKESVIFTKKSLLFSIILLISNISIAQLSGEFNLMEDGHYYFKAVNQFDTHGTIKIRAISYYRDIVNEEYITIKGYGDGFILGPSTPWKWYWHKGDRIYIVYPDGTDVHWECPYTDKWYSLPDRIRYTNETDNEE